MKVAVIVTLFHTPKNEVSRLKDEINNLGFEDYHIYWIDNTANGRGYAGGVNEGIQKGMKDKADIFIVCNPDISLKRLSSTDLLEGRSHFDVWGLAMSQNQKVYYGGEIDRWRLSGGLIEQKPIHVLPKQTSYQDHSSCSIKKFFTKSDIGMNPILCTMRMLIFVSGHEEKD